MPAARTVDSDSAVRAAIPAAFLNLAEFIIGWEGCELTPYRDSAGLWTVGVGHLLEQGAPLHPITQATADALFAADLLKIAGRVERLIFAEVEQHQLDALIDFAFNLGTNALAGSTLLKRVNAWRLNEAADEFLRWDKARVNGGLVRIDGLHKRRVAERQMFTLRDYTGRP